MRVFLLSIVCLLPSVFGKSKSDNDIVQFLDTSYEKTSSEICTMLNKADWDFNTDLNNKCKEQLYLNITLASADFDKNIWEEYFKDLDVNAYSNEETRRRLESLKTIGTSALDEKKLTKLTETKNFMTNVYGTAKICPYKNQNCDLGKDGLALEPEIEQVFSTSHDYDELAYIWKAWRDATGPKIRDKYKIYVDLSNKAASLNGFKDLGEMWRDEYESPNFIADMEALWVQVEPLYSELHQYVARKLKNRFGDKLNISDGLIPNHVFGNLWAQQWGRLSELVKPFPNAVKLNVDGALIEKNYTVLKMFEVANEFYKSLGLIDNEISFDTKKGAMIEKPTDGREVVCHASAWDFCDGQNYRIKMCTKVNFEDFIVIHHEMGHIQYFLQYAHQPITFRSGANPGFHEAIGDTIALSVATPKHLEKLGLTKIQHNEEFHVNSLMTMALDKVAFLPFGLLIDKWRWDVFSGKVKEEQWNAHWVEYRKIYQKIKPPVPRSEKDFDPGAKFHVAADSQYIAYFIAHILQFQFYKSLCVAAGEYDPKEKKVPLHQCDFYKSREAGDILKKGLSLGSSKHWSEVLEVMTGGRKLDAGPLLEYFEPLHRFLKKENSK